MLVEIHDALREAAASEEKARAAAQAIADHDSRFDRIEPDLLVLKWMVGAVPAGVVSVTLRVYFTQARRSAGSGTNP